ncbi:MAG: hypothetical protein KGZ41_00965 [Dethiobacter sp.]|nr:hypothetical protein [Dethiobacter sp.]MBS3898103.1 hypothetical protein [Dethiobacter sp.]MBS3982349.1 hypothetical protein [Dethiobacter sp.]
MYVAEWFTTWLNDYMKLSLRATTWESYKYQVNGHIIPALGNLKIVQLQTAHIQRLYNEKLQGGRLDGKEGGLTPKSVRYIHTVIHSCLAQAKKEGLLTVNPSDAVRLPKLEQKDIHYLDKDGIKLLGDCQGEQALRGLLPDTKYRFAAWGGARVALGSCGL